MIIADIHSHVLPGLDDGSRNMEMSVKMLEKAYESGVRHIVATPHFGGRNIFTDRESLHAAVEALNREAFLRGININVYPGHEVLCSSDVIKYFKSGMISTLNEAGFMLIELPFVTNIPDVAEILMHIKEQTRTRIILAHPERYEFIASNPEMIENLVDKGILIQINADSLRGKNGKQAKVTTKRLMRKGLVHFIASDAHDDSKRTTALEDVYKSVELKYGEKTAQRLFYKNAVDILHGRAPVHS